MGGEILGFVLGQPAQTLFPAGDKAHLNVRGTEQMHRPYDQRNQDPVHRARAEERRPTKCSQPRIHRRQAPRCGVQAGHIVHIPEDPVAGVPVGDCISHLDDRLQIALGHNPMDRKENDVALYSDVMRATLLIGEMGFRAQGIGLHSGRSISRFAVRPLSVFCDRTESSGLRQVIAQSLGQLAWLERGVVLVNGFADVLLQVVVCHLT